MTDHTHLATAISELLNNGAALQLTNPDHTTQSWPLARHHRIEDDVLWIRPLLGGRRTNTGTVVFGLGDCLRRGIGLGSYTVEATGQIQIQLRSGQTLQIRPANPDEAATIDLWDTFTLTVLTAQEEAELDALNTDSWQGRFP